MSGKTFGGRMVCVSLFLLTLCSCFHPPYNNFRPDQRRLRQTSFGVAFGAGMGAMVGTVAGSTVAGAAVGGAVGALHALYKNSRRAMIAELQNQDIHLIEYGDTATLVLPTDHYFVFNSPRINDICYPGLVTLVNFLKYYDCTTIYVAAFSDNVGSRYHKKTLTQARAEAMLTFLWANGIKAQRLHAEGYGDKYDVGDNKLIRGSAYNRRIEIQLVKAPIVPMQASYSMK